MASVRYKADSNHTFVRFGVRHFGASTVQVRFDDVAGEVVLDRAGSTGSADITIQMASVDSGIAYFDAHLCSRDFFDVIRFPTAHFVGHRAVFHRDTLASVQGDLTLLGQTHPVTLTCTNFAVYDNPLHRAEVCGGDFTATLKRSQWGVNWGLDVGVPDDVAIAIQIEAVRQA